MNEDSLFPTFCHIGEYDEAGYRMLHRMLAMSQPLILWAPTIPQLGRDRPGHDSNDICDRPNRCAVDRRIHHGSSPSCHGTVPRARLHLGFFHRPAMAVPIHIRLTGNETGAGLPAWVAERSVNYASMPGEQIGNDNPRRCPSSRGAHHKFVKRAVPSQQSPARQLRNKADHPTRLRLARMSLRAAGKLHASLRGVLTCPVARCRASWDDVDAGPWRTMGA